MKKSYTLDYSIETEADRLQAVRKILDELEVTSTPSDLEQLASYILYGKDENGNKNPVARAAIKRHPETYTRSENKVTSLDAAMATGVIGETNFGSPYVRSPYVKPVRAIQPSDSAIPGMTDLWDAIARLQDTLRHLRTNPGLAPVGSKQHVHTQYNAYKLQHVIISMQRQQYALRDAVRPPIRWAKGYHTTAGTNHINFNEDSAYWMTEAQWRDKLAASYNPRLSRNLADYETKQTPNGLMVRWVVRRQKFDWENQAHVRALIEHYDQLEVQDGQAFDTWGYTLLQDLQMYRKMAEFSPLRDFLLEMRIHAHSYREIAAAVERKYGVKYNDSYLCGLLTNEIPQKIAQAATKHRLKLDTPKDEWKTCARCHEAMPPHAVFFGFNATEPDKLNKNCCRCSKEMIKNDGRKKDKTMHEVPPRKKVGRLSAVAK